MNSAGVSGVRVYDTGAPGPVVAIIGLTHGNEPVGGRLIDEMSDTFSAELVSGSLLCIKANEAAYEQGRRYTLGGICRIRSAGPVTRIRGV